MSVEQRICAVAYKKGERICAVEVHGARLFTCVYITLLLVINNYFHSKMNPTISEIRNHATSLMRLLDNLEESNKTKVEPNKNKDDNPFRVMHLINNPLEMADKAKQKELDQLKKENERLKARLELLESGNTADMTLRIDEAVNKSHQIKVLNQKLDEYKQREEKILTSFRKASREFREVCYLLTGFRIDALKNSIYRLSSMYANSEDDKLFFEISPDGSIQLLKNDYSDLLSDHIKTYLENADSFPAFLASITLDLFKSSTQLATMSMCMSTTVQPNPAYRP